MTVYCIRTSQELPLSMEKAWDFISSPHNLKLITPAHYRVDIFNDVKPQDKMYKGQVIMYKVNPLKGLRLKWVTEITEVNEGISFVDEQKQGPYKMWRHEHILQAIEGGTRMDDILHYEIPLGLIGRIANWLFVSATLHSLFDYRRKKLEVLFGNMPARKPG